MYSRYRNIVFYFIITVILIPIFIHIIGVIKIKPLKGYFKDEKNIEFNLKNWFSGEFQQQYEKVFQQKLRLRPVLVRINNQIRFLIQKEITAANVVQGADGYFYERHYIWTYLGQDYSGEKLIKQKMLDFKQIIDTLKSKNVEFLFILAPGKAEFLPENIPDEYKDDIKNISNYISFRKQSEELKINFIDFNAYFRQIKDTITFPLYTKGGTHWSIYGSYIAIDTIVSYIEFLLKKDIPDYMYPVFDITKRPRGSDKDIANAANLLWYKFDEKLLYPYLQVVDTVKKYKPDISVIADSYYWTIVNNGVQKQLFDNYSFWYYFKENHTNNPTAPKMISDISDLKKEIESKDIIVFLITDGNLREFSWGFIEKMKELYNIHK